MVSHQAADELTRLSDSMGDRWKEARLITKSEDLEFTTSGRGTMAQVVHPGLGHVNAHLGCFIRELPPGKPSGEHRHNFEAVLHVLEGVGYTMMDGVRYDWKVGDTMTVPPMAPHQHFNLDPDNRARIIAVTSLPLMRNLGAFRYEQLQWAEVP